MPAPDLPQRNYAKLLRHRFLQSLEKYKNKKTSSTHEAVDYLYNALSVRDAEAHLDYHDAGSPANDSAEFCPFSPAELAFELAVQQNDRWLNYCLQDNYGSWTSYHNDRSELDQVIRVCEIFKMEKRLAKLRAFDEMFPQITEAYERTLATDSHVPWELYRHLVDEIESMPGESYEEAEEMFMEYYQANKDQFLNALPET